MCPELNDAEKVENGARWRRRKLAGKRDDETAVLKLKTESVFWTDFERGWRRLCGSVWDDSKTET
jgi:hypothetical protein